MEKPRTESIRKMQSRICQNCEFHYNGNYCTNCGQKFLTGRFQFRESIGWVFDQFFNLERGVFLTIKSLIFNTNEMLTKYFKKATNHYMHPFRFAFLLATISALATVLSGTFDSSFLMDFSGGFTEGWNNYDVDKSEQLAKLEVGIEVIETIKKYFAFILLINIPFYALGSFIVYYKRKLNFTEHLILNCYALGLALLIGLPLNLLMLVDNGLLVYGVLSPFLTMFSYAFVYSRFFKENYFLSILKTIVIYILLGILVFLILSVGIMFEKMKG